MRALRVGLAQINTTVGDLEGNVAKVLEYVGRARDLGADVVAFPELTITGYPPEDLLLRPPSSRDNLEALERVVEGCARHHRRGRLRRPDDDIYNAAAVIHDGRLADVYHKQFLPNYGVFDEKRYFRPGEGCPVFAIAGVGVGVNICEDIWYPGEPTRAQAQAGAQVIININGSPYHAGKRELPRADAGHPRRRQRRLRLLHEPGRRPGRAGLRRQQHGFDPDGRAHRPRGDVRGGAAGLRPGPEERLRRACTTRAAARSGARPRTCADVALSEAPLPAPRSRPSQPRLGAAAGGRGGGLRRARHRHPRLRAQERLPEGDRRPLRRHRLQPRGGGRRRRPRRART